MRYTVFDTPVVSQVLRGFSVLFLALAGWRKEGKLPDIPKYVVAGAYHTSALDVPLGLMFAFAYGVRICWMGKHTLFQWPFRRLFLWLGGIPIDRTRAHGVVAASVRAFHENDRLVMLIAPEGTRQKRAAWKKGFYYIAYGARVPILLAFIDYRRKVVGTGPLITPSGNIEADMRIVRDFYAHVTPKYPGLATLPAVETNHTGNGHSAD